MNRTKIIVSFVLLLVLLGTAITKIRSKEQGQNQRRSNSPVVKVSQATVQEVIEDISFTGDVLPFRQVNVTSRVGGVVEKVLVQMGDRVSGGQLLAQIDTTELAQQWLQAAASSNQTRSNYNRSRDLLAKSLISQEEFDNAESASRIADATREAARLRLEFASIRAPFSGVITRRYLDAGAVVTVGSSQLFTVMDFDVVKIVVEVLEKDVARITTGMEASLKVDAYPDQIFTGRVVRSSESLSPQTRTMAIEIDVPNRDHRLKPGMFASVSITLARHPEAMVIPSKALQKDGTGYFVWKVSEGVAAKQRVEVGKIMEESTEIISGLAPTDSFVSEGMQLIRTETKVEVKS
jgi:membrane fusion protein (multidrug efflux system)